LLSAARFPNKFRQLKTVDSTSQVPGLKFGRDFDPSHNLRTEYPVAETGGVRMNTLARLTAVSAPETPLRN